ncbi:protein-ADP-ribose hydrolase [Anaeromicropila herbilytica]|uniref:Macro domain-containing protein n=1 Tax=Anaeromicropila herbilytica TaxID=2785025 RepID=A0A7R7ICP4_9FIRM|nr:protein-ADP-ribose hydrolase [Anaeromicropila herbilytica]BCN30963.1 hypothetical protein bsdtb5_22580 [Anaeromicropila herbilytica]
MTHEEKRIWLIRQLINENPEYSQYRIPDTEQDQKDLLRALMNVRMPKPIINEFLAIQDEYLLEESNVIGYVDVNKLEVSKKNQQIILWQGDITTLKIDAIVNAANSQMCGCFRVLHNCVDNIIHTKSGIQLRLKCNELMQKQGHEEETGKAKITPAYNLPCDYVIHTVGPIVQGKLTVKHEELLASCYHSCLELAKENNLTSIAFCCISTGVFMFPNRRAAEIAVNTVQHFMEETGSKMKVVFNVFKDEDREIYDLLLNK